MATPMGHSPSAQDVRLPARTCVEPSAAAVSVYVHHRPQCHRPSRTSSVDFTLYGMFLSVSCFTRILDMDFQAWLYFFTIPRPSWKSPPSGVVAPLCWP